MLKNLIANNRRVILISDMCLPINHIKKMLHKADSALADIPCYLSCESGYTKGTGKTYEYVKEQENVEYSQWTHIDDNKNCINKAKAFGIQAKLYRYIQLEPYEKKVLEQYFYDPAIHLMVGCAKNTRLHFSKNPKADIGISLGGPILYPFASWLLNQCQKRKIKRLYFIARDGYILQKIADYLIAKRNLDIETHYIYGSRKAFRLSALKMDNGALHKQFMYWLTESPDPRKSICLMLRLNEDELMSMLPKDLKQCHKKRNKQKLYDYLLHNGDIIVYALEKNKQQRRNTLKYLQDSIDYSNDDFAFVEYNGNGFTQNCLASLINEFYNKPTSFFYFNEVPRYECINTKRFSFFVSNWFGEIFAKAPHGQTLGYDDNGKPIIDDIVDTWHGGGITKMAS